MVKVFTAFHIALLIGLFTVWYCAKIVLFLSEKIANLPIAR